jgi:phosphoribosylformylglycinamidine synthase
MNDIAVIQFPGVNCEYETVRVLESVGLSARVVRWNAGSREVASAPAIVVPGGFSYQDRIRAGVVAAKDPMTDTIVEAVARGVPVLGVCNGAQILVEAGVVPGFHHGSIDVALAPNRMPDRTGYFCAWVRVKKGPARCIFTDFMDDLEDDRGSVPVPIGHAEGRFTTASQSTIERLRKGEGVALVYAAPHGEDARAFPDNPNGSLHAIAGLTNPSGNVLALMPHPERASWMHQVPETIGGIWAERRARADVRAAGPGRGFFDSLRRALS